MPRPRPCTSRTWSKPAAAAAAIYSTTTEGISRGANACKSISRSSGTRVMSAISDRRARVGGRDEGLDAAANREIADHRHAPRVDRVDQIVEDLVGDRFVKDALVAEFDQIVLQRLELDARGIGHVGDSDLAEIGQPRLGANRRKLRALNRDLVVALRARVGKRLERRA